MTQLGEYRSNQLPPSSIAQQSHAVSRRECSTACTCKHACAIANKQQQLQRPENILYSVYVWRVRLTGNSFDPKAEREIQSTLAPDLGLGAVLHALREQVAPV